MNDQLKTVLLTLITLSLVSIAFIEMSGISKTALINKFGDGSQQINDEAQKELTVYKNFQDSIAALPKTNISFDDRGHDFGKVKEGETVSHIYTFTNTGEQPLIIADVIPTCGCTVPDYSKKPVLPGEKGNINIEFHSKNQKGKVHKNIIVVSNAEQDKLSLSFDADVFQ